MSFRERSYLLRRIARVERSGQGRATAAAPATPGAMLAHCRGCVEACAAARVAGGLGQLS